MPEIGSPTFLVWIINNIILALLIVAAFLVGRDARRRGDSWLAAVAWASLTLFVLPIGLGLYFFLGRHNSTRNAACLKKDKQDLR